MPAFSTPSPIDVAIKLPVGRIEVIASERSDAVVTVTPSNPDKATDRRGADETTVDFDGQRLTITAPRPRISWMGPGESVDILVALPTGSRLTSELSAGNLQTRGRLGATRVKNSFGTVDMETTGDLWLRAGHGNVTVTSAEGGLEITADHGQIRLGSVTGDAILKASHGSIRVEKAGGELDARLSFGDLEIVQALGPVSAKTAYGSIQLHEVSSGSVQVESGYGQITIGVRAGVPAWLDLSSKAGRVRNELTGEGAPEPSEQSVAVHARTQYGDITIQRASSR